MYVQRNKILYEKMKPKLFSHMYKLFSEDLGDVCFLAE